MGKQYNKVEKAARRKRYNARKKEEVAKATTKKKR
jgi:hypothetical protein